MTGIFALLAAAAAGSNGRRIATQHREVETSYVDLAEQATGLGEMLRERGVGAGDRVALLLHNGPSYVVAYFGVAAIGAITVPLNTRLTAGEIGAILEDSAAKLVIVEDTLADAVGAAWQTIPLEALPARPSGERFEAAPVTADTVAHLYYTSGTTGAPKGVMLTHGNVTAHAAMAIAELELGPHDVWGHIAPMFHLADAWAVFAITQVGGTHTFVDEFSAERALDAIARERITISNLVPTMLQRLVAARRERHDTSSLRAILSGGAPIAPDTVAAIVDRFGCEYVQTYGMTETSPFLTMSLLDDALRALPEPEQMAYRAKTGRPVLGVELRVVDAAGDPVPPDETSVGEIQVRGATVTAGYWQQPDATREAFTDDGFLHTGDLAVLDARGFVTIVDRAKDVILTGGETVYSIEIENRLYEHPAVLEAAVVGRPDATWGERVVGFVALRDGAISTPEELIAFCREQLAGFKCPKELHVLDALPRTGSGKLEKRSLR